VKRSADPDIPEPRISGVTLAPPSGWPTNQRVYNFRVADDSGVYGNEYNAKLSDDLDPTLLDGCGFRGCGGWGYYYLNLTKAPISLYRNETPDITVRALSGPAVAHPEKSNHLHHTWNYLGKISTGYSLKLDGRTVADKLTGDSFDLDLRNSPAGKHVVKLVANGVHTYVDLDPQRMTQKSQSPLPVESTVVFTYAP
jgi:hypothetical protein